MTEIQISLLKFRNKIHQIMDHYRLEVRIGIFRKETLLKEVKNKMNLKI